MQTTTTTATTGTSPATTGVSVQRSYVGVLAGHHRYVYAENGRQYVFVRTTAEAGEWPSVSVTLDGETYDSQAPSETHAEYRGESVATPIVSVPLDVAPSDGTVAVGSTSRALGSELLDRLANPPRFEVVSTEVPESVRADQHLVVSVTVAHRGGRDEAFRTNITNFTSQPTIVERWLSAGESTTIWTDLAVYASQMGEYEIEFDWGYGSVGTPVTVESRQSTTTAGGSDADGENDAPTTTADSSPSR